LMKRLRKLTGG